MRIIVLAIVSALVGFQAQAENIATETRAALQTAMLSHLDQVTVEGQYLYLDQADDTLRVVFPANIHPMIVPVEGGYFLCSEMVDASGTAVTADFFVRETAGGFRVVQMILNDRGSLETMMGKSS